MPLVDGAAKLGGGEGGGHEAEAAAMDQQVQQRGELVQFRGGSLIAEGEETSARMGGEGGFHLLRREGQAGGGENIGGVAGYAAIGDAENHARRRAADSGQGRGILQFHAQAAETRLWHPCHRLVIGIRNKWHEMLKHFHMA